MENFFKKISTDDIAIPGMPQIAVKMLALLDDEYCSLKKLEDLILEDQALTVNILKIANAPYYGTGKSVTTLKDAILAIGMHNLLAIVSVIALTNQLTAGQFDGDLINHALAVSVASALVARHAKLVTEEEALVAGLIHDVGKTIFLANAPAQFAAVKGKARSGKRPFVEIERELIGLDHCAIGGMVAEKWRLPKLYEHVIRNHHNSGVKDPATSQVIRYEELLCAIVRLADKVVLDAGIGIGKSSEQQQQELLDMLKIGESVYIEIVKKIAFYGSGGE